MVRKPTIRETKAEELSRSLRPVCLPNCLLCQARYRENLLEKFISKILQQLKDAGHSRAHRATNPWKWKDDEELKVISSNQLPSKFENSLWYKATRDFCLKNTKAKPFANPKMAP